MNDLIVLLNIFQNKEEESEKKANNCGRCSDGQRALYVGVAAGMRFAISEIKKVIDGEEKR